MACLQRPEERDGDRLRVVERYAALRAQCLEPGAEGAECSNGRWNGLVLEDLGRTETRRLEHRDRWHRAGEEGVDLSGALEELISHGPLVGTLLEVLDERRKIHADQGAPNQLVLRSDPLEQRSGRNTERLGDPGGRDRRSVREDDLARGLVQLRVGELPGSHGTSAS